MSLGLPHDVVAGYDDRLKVTYWELLEERHDRMKGGGDNG